MADGDWNTQVIEEFRANEGRVGGQFKGAPLVLVHHRGSVSGDLYISPMMYLAADDDPEAIYVFASNAGDPENPAWYANLVANGIGSVEVGTDAYPVTVTELHGPERDNIYAEQSRRYPGFAEYEAMTAGIRIIPVLRLRRAT